MDQLQIILGEAATLWTEKKPNQQI